MKDVFKALNDAIDEQVIKTFVGKAPTKEEILGELRAYGMLDHHTAKFKALELAERIRKYGINLGESQNVRKDDR